MRGKPKGGDFTLQSADGPVSLHDMRGKVVMLFFGYTSCPAACPTTLTTISDALSQLGEDEINLTRVIFVSIDPERDTLPKLKEFTSYFHPNIIGVTDRPEVVLEVSDQYGALYFKEKMPDSSLGYSFLHDTAIFFISPDGKLVESLRHDAGAEKIVETIRRLLTPFAEARDNLAKRVTVSNLYVQAVPPVASNTAAYMKLNNGNKNDIRLIRVSSPVCRSAELHRSVYKEGLMKMSHVDGIMIKGHENIILKPEGFHIMLIDLKKPLKIGDKVPITLNFNDGSSLTIEAKVRK